MTVTMRVEVFHFHLNYLITRAICRLRMLPRLSKYFQRPTSASLLFWRKLFLKWILYLSYFCIIIKYFSKKRTPEVFSKNLAGNKERLDPILRFAHV